MGHEHDTRAGVQVFNGFVDRPFDVIHQSAVSMRTWLDKLREAVPDLLTFTEQRLEDCWLWNRYQAGKSVWASADHPNEPKDRYKTPDDALRSQILLHQRFLWLARAANMHQKVNTWVWIEPTVFKQRGITRKVIEQFVQTVKDHPFDAISLPGMWPKQPIQDHINHWRFAGSCWVCPAKYVKDVWEAVRTIVPLRARLTNRVCWDNSTWSYLELLNILPIRWYPGNHDETQFTGYLHG